nr:MAG TPA: hypothetical protein [Caudoviricetes sp.]
MMYYYDWIRVMQRVRHKTRLQSLRCSDSGLE